MLGAASTAEEGNLERMSLLEGLRVVTLAINLPGPLAVSRLCAMGASVIKVEPPSGDPLGIACRDWYDDLHKNVDVKVLNLKEPGDCETLDGFLADADLLVTANRLAALARLGLDWDSLHGRFPNLCCVCIVGHGPPHENHPGHDLTYQAELGILVPERMPRVLVADMAGAEEAVSAALALLLARERGGGAGFVPVSLCDSGHAFAEPYARGLTAPGGFLGGGLPNYNIYAAKEGHIALAALEAALLGRLHEALSLESSDSEEYARAFLTRTAMEWEDWARENNLPIMALRSC